MAKPTWDEVREKMQAQKAILRSRGSVSSKQDSLPKRYTIRYTVLDGHKRRRRAIQLGTDLKVVEKAKHLLERWQDEYRRIQGGLPCDRNTEISLMREHPALAGYGSQARQAYRKRLRQTRGDPLALLTFLAGYSTEEAAFPGTSKLRGEE